MQFNFTEIKQFLDFCLAEDLGIGGDITSKALIDQNKIIDFRINSRENIIFCGQDILEYFLVCRDIKYKLNYHDTALVPENDNIAYGSGRAHDILLFERTILNFLQHLSGIATTTNIYVNKIKDSKAKICDTRKTIPGLRKLQKYAVRCGGGINHRLAIDSSILIKDNHIAICGSINKAISRARSYAPFYTKIEIECDNLKQVEEAIKYGADIIMLDNMSLNEIELAAQIIGGKALIDVSGNVSLENVSDIANLGVDYISIGKLTHSVKAVDIGLDI